MGAGVGLLPNRPAPQKTGSGPVWYFRLQVAIQIRLVHTVGQELFKAFGDGGFVGGVGDTEPFVLGGEDLDGDGLFLQELTDEDGQQIFRFQGILGDIGLEEDFKMLFQSTQESGGQAPHVHGDETVGVHGLAVGLGTGSAGLYVFGFHHIRQEAPAIHLAQAPGDTAVFGQGVFQDEARHAESIVRVVLAEEIMDGTVDAFAVVVIGIDDGKGTVDQLLGGQHRLTGTPGLGAALRQLPGNVRQGLEAVAHLHALLGADRFNAVADDLPEVLFNVPADDKHDFIEARGDGIMNGIVHDDVSGAVNTGQLLDAAAKPTADTGCHNYESCFFQEESPPINMIRDPMS